MSTLNNEQLIEVIKTQNELIRLLAKKCELRKWKPDEEASRIGVLLKTLKDFNEQFNL